MPMGILFWVLMILWAISVYAWPVSSPFVIFLLLGLLGWKVFGPVLQ